MLGVELGHGYFGAVHRGVWRQGTEVAVKTLRHKEGRQEADFEREKATFLAETEVMKRLNHPHLVKMLGICVEKSPFYLVQELCQNGDLKHYLKSFDFIKVGSLKTSKTIGITIVVPLQVYQSMPHNYLQNNKKADKFKNVPSLSSLISWCSDILKGGNIVKLQPTPHQSLPLLQECVTWRVCSWSTGTSPPGTCSWTPTSGSVTCHESRVTCYTMPPQGQGCRLRSDDEGQHQGQ